MNRNKTSSVAHAEIGILTMAALFGISATIIHSAAHVEWHILLRDANVICKAPFYNGFLSNAGMVFWFSTASAFLLTGLLTCGDGTKKHSHRFYLGMSLLNYTVGIDDLFMAHEMIFPFYVGIPEEVLIAVYVFFALFLTIAHIDSIISSRWGYLLSALSFFSLSILIDSMHSTQQYLATIEDLSKFAGITLWSVYGWSTCMKKCMMLINPKVTNINGGIEI